LSIILVSKCLFDSTILQGKKRGIRRCESWKYQFSVPTSEHGADLDAYQIFNREKLGEGTMSTAFRTAVQLIWGRFIIYNDPTLPPSIIASIATASKADITAASTDNWPVWEGGGDGGNWYKMLNFNMTGGVPIDVLWTAADGVSFNVIEAQQNRDIKEAEATTAQVNGLQTVEKPHPKS
jgi:hypothetical protein